MDSNTPCFMITQYPMDGTDAATIHMAELSNHLALAGVPVRLICPGSRRSQRTVSTGVPCLSLPALGRGLVRALTFQLPLALTLLSLAARRRLGCLYVRHSGLLLVPALVAASCRIPLVLEVNGVVSEELPLVHPSRSVRLMAALVRLVEAANFRLATSLVVVASSLKETLVRDYRLDPVRIHVIPNGANVAHFRPRPAAEARAELGLQAEGPVVGFVGNLQRWHGVDLLIAAAPHVLAQLPATHLLVVGDGPQREELARRAEELGIAGKVSFTGAVPYSDTPVYMASFDVCAAPFPASQRNSRIGGSPLKVYEYAACGRPVVVSTALPIWREIAEAEAGLTVPPGDPQALAAALVALLRAPLTRARMGKRAREYAVARGSWARTAKMVEHTIAAACRLRRGSSRPQTALAAAPATPSRALWIDDDAS